MQACIVETMLQYWYLGGCIVCIVPLHCWVLGGFIFGNTSLQIPQDPTETLRHMFVFLLSQM